MSDTLVVAANDLGVLVATEVERLLVDIDQSTVVITETAGDTIVITELPAQLVEHIDSHTVFTTSAEQGIPGRDGAGGDGAGVFILDVQPVSGIVAQKQFVPDTVPANAQIAECTSDTPMVRVLVGCDGGTGRYSPSITVNELPVALTESGTKRWFTGTVDVPLDGDTTTLRAKSGMVETTALVHLAGAGPAVLSVVLGDYPGVQTALKAGDLLPVTVLTDPAATFVTLTGPATTLRLPVVNGSASGMLVMDGSTGLLPFTAKAENGLGTVGAATQSLPARLDQVKPTFSNVIISYPNGDQALNTGEQASVFCTVYDADSVAYSGTGLIIDQPAVYSAAKAVQHSLTGYQSTSYRITAHRAANDSAAATTAGVLIATSAPTAALAIVPAGRLASSPVGIDYTVVLNPSQPLLIAPVLNAGAGMWQGAWAFSGGVWRRTLRVADATARGPAKFSAMALKGPSGIAGSVITSGEDYTVGGFSLRVLTFAAYSRTAALGATVATPAKLAASVVGGNALTVQTDNAVLANGFYPANADGSYNASGTYIGLSDAAFAGSNTSGTLQVQVQETA